MLPSRRLLLILTCLTVGGSLVGTTLYGLRLRSDGYRLRMQRDLSRFFDLPCDIGRIRPLTFSSRAFDDVVIWLADRRAEVFRCNRAVWHERREAGTLIQDLDLLSGMLSVAADAWQREDYRRVLRSGLGHDFETLHLGEVRLHDFHLQFRHGDFRLTCGQAEGVLTLGRKDDGAARLTAVDLNGFPTVEPIQIAARFNPSEGVRVRDLVLTVPEIPLAALGLNALLDAPAERGRFAGRIEYQDDSGEPEVIVSGRLADVAAEDFTAGLDFGPIRGTLNVTIDRARIADRLMTHLSGRGEVRGVVLADFAPLLAGKTLSGGGDLNVRQIDAALGRLNRLVLDGALDDLSLEECSALLGRGRATGRLSVTINALRVRDDVIEWADVEVRAAPPEGSNAGTIDRELLLGGVQEFLGLTWPEALPQSLLPQRIEYTQFGVRLLVRKNRLRVLGTHGPRGDTILTLRLLGRDWGVVKSLAGEIDLAPMIAALRQKAAERDPHEMQRWLRERARRAGNASTAPAR